MGGISPTVGVSAQIEVTAASMPALTGDVTSSAGSVATTLVNIPAGTTAAGRILATAIAAPATPSAGVGSVYVDSTSKNIAVKDDAGVVKHGVQTKALVASSFVTAIDDAGVVSVAIPVESFVVAASDETTAITATTNKVKFRMPYAFTLTAVRASLSTAQASGNTFTVDINKNLATVLSTKLTIDNTATTSVGAGTPPVISVSSFADNDEVEIDVDQIGDGTAKGLKVTLIGAKT